ncbi:MAG: response regulator transcription factor [Acetobacteraceae bacterium]|nr:response regulator transcription factor [Acetobacteraceae bacterium]
MAERVLVVDDERPIAEILRYNLEKAGFSVSLAFDGEEALAKAEQERPDLVILDIMLPSVDGYAVCQKLRTRSDVPILMLTAKDQEHDKVAGLDLGADDYVTKPFSPRELVARVRALLRRAQGTLARDRAGAVLAFGSLVIDTGRYRVTRDGRPVELTSLEFQLLKYLASNPGQVYSREKLLEDVWGYEFFGDSRTVDVTVRRLREKLEEDPGQPRYIQTKRGVGYYFSPSSG